MEKKKMYVSNEPVLYSAQIYNLMIQFLQLDCI